MTDTKINNTTSYPNTTPALTDHVIGTDVSNTSNHADGETVTFLFSDILTLSAPGWSLVETVWDKSVDGAQASAETSAFVDNYDYMVRFEGFNGLVTATVNVEIYKETDAAYHASKLVISSSLLPTEYCAGDVIFGDVRQSTLYKTVQPHLSGKGTLTSTEGVSGADVSVQGAFKVDPAQKVTKVRVSMSTGNMNNGTVKLYRRPRIAF